MSQPYTAEHTWVGATFVPLSESVARHAERRGTARVEAEIKVEILEVCCSQCRRPYDAVAGRPCEAAESREHLIGGPVDGARRKRKHPDHDCAYYGCDVATVSL